MIQLDALGLLQCYQGTGLGCGRCSVQRIARRAHVLPAARTEVLTVLGFDWTAADALS